jgi:hypothetical protein
MQHTTLANPDAAGGTGDRRKLFRGKFVHSHLHSMRKKADVKQFTLEHFPEIIGDQAERPEAPGQDREFGGWERAQEATAALVVEDHGKQRVVDVDFAAVVVDEAELAEFVHEEIYAGARGTYHFSQGFLRNFGQRFLRIAGGTITRQQQQSAREAFLAGIEELVDQIFFDADVARQHVSDETVGELVLFVEHANHLVLFDNQDGGGCDGSGCSHAAELAPKTSFAKKITGAENRNDGFPAGLVDYGKLHAAFLNVHHVFGGIALGEYGFFFGEFADSSAEPGGIEEALHIEGAVLRFRS